MSGKAKKHITLTIFMLAIIFLIVSGTGLFAGSKYIDSKLLKSNINHATDIALLVKNNFEITDEEVAYMKSLSFNEMEVDPINFRLMNIGNGVRLSANITNVYLVAPLSEDEIKYYTDEDTAEFFGYDINTPLNGIWLLNGTIDDNGHFAVAEREDIYRYTSLDAVQLKAIANQETVGTYTTDAWGSFITGYTPIYTTEGNFVGLLGIDMNPDAYQASAKTMIVFMILAFAVTAIIMVGIFLIFYFKYTKIKEGQLSFEFYSRMSHDMRTPMNAILGMAELSKDETNLATLHNNFEKVEDSGRYMLGLINDTLELQRIDTGRLSIEPEPVYCVDVLHNILDMMNPVAKAKNIDIKVECINLDDSICCKLDPLRFKQIFMNLLSNAVKFTPENGNVTLTLELLSKEDSIYHFKIIVADTGVGMSEEFMKKGLFKPFEQEKNPMTASYAGTGLGMAITKRIVELMDGSIEVKSIQGKGTTFTLLLDLEAADFGDVFPLGKENDDENKMAPEEVLSGRHILIIEDNKLNLEIAKRLLTKEGAIVIGAENGKEGVEIFEKSELNFFDAVLMDIHMPVMDGLTASRTIRALEREDSASVPIIAMTANAYREDIQASLDAGMNDHLSKPVDSRLLFVTLAKYIIKRRE